VIPRLLKHPVVAALAVPALVVVVLAIDRNVGLGGQLVLGVIAFALLALACRWVDRRTRVQVAVLVVVATCGEVLASLVWGLYTYRLDNIPLFVPPGHGLVYLGGLAVVRAFAGRERVLVGAALGAVVAWAVAGLTVLPRMDVGGAICAAGFAYVLLTRSRATVYAGVFLVVGFLEIYGTAVGTWLWAETIPTLGVPNGNPPSGAAIGYVVLEATAIRVAAGVSRVRIPLLRPARSTS
jgi:hypothetical protein